MTRNSFGVRIDDELFEKLTQIIEDSKYLNITRSELIEAILDERLSVENSLSDIQDLIIRRRLER